MDHQPDTSAVLDELKRLDGQIDVASDLGSLKPIFYRLEEITRDNSADFDVQMLVSDIKQHLMNRGMQLKEEGAVPTGTNPVAASSPAVTPPPMAPISAPISGMPPLPPTPSGFGTTSGPAYGTQESPAPPPFPPTAPELIKTAAMPVSAPPEPPRDVYIPPVRTPAPPPPQEPPPAPVNWKKPVLIGGGIGLVVVLAIFGVVYLKNRNTVKPPPISTAVAVSVATLPAGADVRVNGQSKCTANCRIDLEPGSYNLSAILPGYEEALQTVTVERGHPLTLSLTLTPQAPSLKILTDVASGGQVLLDGHPAGALQDGQLVLDRLAAGQHEVKITGKGVEAEFSFQVNPGAAPAIQGPIKIRNAAAVIASALGNQIHVNTSVTPMKVALDGNSVGDAGADGIDLKNLPPGDHELTLNDGKDERKLTVSTSSVPVLTAWINTSTSGGTLVVTAGEDGATVFIDDKPYPRKTRRGQLWIANLPPKDYRIKVVKQGFQDTAEQTASVKKGAEARIAFKLQAIPQIAVLHINGGTAGAEVLVDNQSVGKVDSSGSLSANVPPGERTLEIRRDQYTPKTFTQIFKPGETVELAGDRVVLEHSTGTLRLTVTPKEVQVTIKRSDEARATPIFAGSHPLTAGTYVVSGKAPGYSEFNTTVQIRAGESVPVDVRLTKEGPVVKPPTVKADWERPGDWKPENGWLTHTGGNFVPFSAKPSTGLFTFTVQLLKGGVFKKHIQWRVNYIDERNYIGFQMDKKSLESKIISNGKTTNRPKVQIDGEEPFMLQIEINPDSVVHRLREGDQWVVIDTLPRPGVNQGKFGFYVPGSDEIAIAGFTFTPR